MTMTPIQAAVKRAWAKGFGPGLADPPFGEDDAKDIITAFLDAAAGDAVARAIWETWRKSDIAPEMYHDFAWEELRALGLKYPAPEAPGRMLNLALAEGKAAITALKEAVG